MYFDGIVTKYGAKVVKIFDICKKNRPFGAIFLGVRGYGLPVTGFSDVQKHLILYHSRYHFLCPHC